MKIREIFETATSRISSLVIIVLVGTSAPSSAASLQVSPVSFDLPASIKASQLTLHNLGDAPLDAQIRVYRWNQKDGAEELVPSTDVIASPPAATLAPRQDYVVRLVRVADKPVADEESYRLLIDEIPDSPSSSSVSNVRFMVRYSIPIFFAQPESKPQLAWTTSIAEGQLSLLVRNDGSRHVRISGLKAEDPSGSNVSFGAGLNGYVLAHSKMRWTVPTTLKDLAPGAIVKITAQGDNGPVVATSALQATTN